MDHDFILLDRSGSMASLWTEAINSINSYVHKLAEQKVDTGVTLAVFDTAPQGDGMEFRIIRERIIPSTWHDVSPNEAGPRNGTPLNDATAKLVSMAEAGGYNKVAIIIMTDGQENASKEYKGYEGTQKIKEMLDRCRAKNWQVVFLGANFDNAAQAASYGNSIRSTIQTSAVNLASTMGLMASSRTAYGVTGQSMEFTDEQKAKLKETTPTK